MNTLVSAAAAAPLALGWPVHAWRLRRRIEAARRDPLTGLPTRATFEHAAARLLAAGPVVVVLVDLDGFKQVNDTHGHHVGDLVIRGAGHGLTEWNTDRAHGVVARLGGDEFAACFPAPDAARARLTLGGLHGLLTAPLCCPDAAVAVGASIGGCWTARPQMHGLPVLLRRADEAMYAAKLNGGGMHVTDQPDASRPRANGRRAGRPGTAHPEGGEQS